MRSYHLLFYKNIGLLSKKKTYICANSHLERKDASLSGCEKEGEREKCIREKVRERLKRIQNSGFFFNVNSHSLCSLHDSNPLLLTSVVNIKQRTVN